METARCDISVLPNSKAHEVQSHTTALSVLLYLLLHRWSFYEGRNLELTRSRNVVGEGLCSSSALAPQLCLAEHLVGDGTPVALLGK
eukprot:732452-Pyramimonas_sp.AAC.1